MIRVQEPQAFTLHRQRLLWEKSLPAGEHSGRAARSVDLDTSYMAQLLVVSIHPKESSVKATEMGRPLLLKDTTLMVNTAPPKSIWFTDNEPMSAPSTH